METDALLPENNIEKIPIVGIQAAPARFDALNRLAARVGLDRITQFNTGSFHQMALNEMYEELHPEGFPESNIKAYETHRELVKALGRGAIDMAMIAVDNNYSGRVGTAIDELRKPENEFRITGRVTIAVEQHILHHRKHSEADIEHVISQKPALDQVAHEKEAQGWTKMIEAKDTVLSAMEVARKKGIIKGKPTAAIASRVAGEANGLNVGLKVSKEGNATTFWRITKEKQFYPEENANRLAFTFSTTDHPGSLYDTVAAVSDLGYDFTDIDCHLAPEDGHRVFFVEVKIPEDRNGVEALQELSNVNSEESGQSNQFKPIGVYADITREEVSDVIRGQDKLAVPDAVNTINWSREGSEYEEGSSVVYVDAKNEHGSLKGMLAAFRDRDVNIVDMSRPVSTDGNGSRGFYFVAEPGSDVGEVLSQLELNKYFVTHYKYFQKELALAA